MVRNVCKVIIIIAIVQKNVSYNKRTKETHSTTAGNNKTNKQQHRNNNSILFQSCIGFSLELGSFVETY